MFDKAKKMFQFQQQARQIQKELRGMSFTAETSNGRLKVTSNGEMELTEVALTLDQRDLENSGKLSREIVDVVNKAIKKAQKASAERMRPLMGGSGMPGF